MGKIHVNTVPSEYRAIVTTQRFMGKVKFTLNWLTEKF